MFSGYRLNSDRELFMKKFRLMFLPCIENAVHKISNL
uniref:Uncharacterized protein n=1 Tax=Anguilla anguilla TaxID=7936 RepID=A0A0E9SFJ6_ANGAN